jgi:hypothetical protein
MRVLLFAALAASLHWSGVADAQSAALLPKEGPDARNARQRGWQYAGCLVSAFPQVTNKLLVLPADSEGFRKEYGSVVNSSCAYALNGTQLPSQILRGYVFEFYAKAKFSENLGDVSAKPPVDYSGEYRGEIGESAKAQIALAQFGDCVVRTNPTSSLALLKGMPASSSESSALATLLPTFSACVLAGQKIAFSRSVLRSAVARAVYELSRPSPEMVR